MFKPMSPLPTEANDPRLDGWYHTIDLAPGITSRGHFRHRSLADKVGLPESLAGKSALDVGTAEGFWAFELERRGADRVTAIDLACAGDCDLVPTNRAAIPEETLRNQTWPARFATARAMRGSQVDYRILSVYDLSPETLGVFDVVYCGSLLLHLHNPLQALINIHSVTRQMAVIETATLPELDECNPGLDTVHFGNISPESRPGEHVTYWLIGPKALCKMLRYAGFSSVESRGVLQMEQGDGFMWVTSAVAQV